MPRGVYQRTKFNNYILANFKGKHLPEELKKRLSDIKKKNPTRYWLGKKRPELSLRNWKGGRKVNWQGYIHIYRPNHPFARSDGYMREQRLIAEQHLDRYLTKEEVIHHINKIKDDNCPENLYLFSNKWEHDKFHKINNPPILISNLVLTSSFE